MFVEKNNVRSSTLSWFQASISTNAVATSPTSQLGLDKDGSVAAVNVTVNFSLTNKTACDLTDGADGKVYFITDGSLVKEVSSGGTAVGAYWLSATFDDTSDPNIAAMNGKTYKFEITGVGNAVALMSSASALNTNVADGSSNHLYVHGKVSSTTIVLSNEQDANSGATDYNGSKAALSTDNTLAYAIRPNQTEAKEYVTSSETSYKAGGQEVTEWAASTDYSSGNIRYHGTAVYRCTSDSTADNKTTFAESDGWTKVCDLHTADKIHVEFVSEVAAS